MVFIAEEGSHIHIPKGCLHIFRKMRVDSLPEDDCHCTLRADLIQKRDLKVTANPICLSIAFDWYVCGFFDSLRSVPVCDVRGVQNGNSLDKMLHVLDRMFIGSDANGINRQVASIVECAGFCRIEGRTARTLAIPEVCILKIAAVVAGLSAEQSSRIVADWDDVCGRPSWKETAAGILPSLRYIVERDTSVVAGMTVGEPETHVSDWAMDPCGNEYFCMICDQELSNTFFRCDGCANLLYRDFLICTQCYADGTQRRKVSPSVLEHTDDRLRGGTLYKCVCRAGPCDECTRIGVKSKGKGSRRNRACTCHLEYSPRFRFFKPSVRHCSK
jgi:hypothetical protein